MSPALLCADELVAVAHAVDPELISAHTRALFGQLFRRRSIEAPAADIETLVKRAADKLPQREAEAVWLVDVCGLTYKQAALEVGVSVERFAKRLHHGRRAIRRSLRAAQKLR